MTFFYYNNQGQKITDYYNNKRDEKGEGDSKEKANYHEFTIGDFNGRLLIS